jgi:hypothetical protein
MRTCCVALTVLVFSLIVLDGWLHCSGDTDGCDPSWVNTALVAYGATVGLVMLWRALTFASGRRFAIELALAWSVVYLVAVLT